MSLLRKPAGVMALDGVPVAQAESFDRGDDFVFDDILNITWMQNAAIYVSAAKRISVFAIMVLFSPMTIAMPIGVDDDIATIDFDSASPGIGLTEHLEDGFRMSVIEGHFDLFDGGMNIDNWRSGPDGSSTVRLDFFGDAFDFLSFEVLYWHPNPGDLDLDEVAFLTSSAGAYVEIMSAGVMYFFGSEWRDVSWIDFTVIDPNSYAEGLAQDNLYLDNIRVSVPEPGTLALFGIGLLGLAASRGRKADPCQ